MLPIRVVIADDHIIFRDGLKLLFRNQNDIELVGEASDGNELLALVEAQQPDVVITDIKMPNLNGIKSCLKIRQQYPSTRVIALSMFNDDNLIVDMLEAGATGYLLKNTTREETHLAIKTVFSGGTYYSNATSKKLARLIADSKVNLHQYKVAPPKFTSREIEIITLICEQLTNREIAERLHLSNRTVESHRERIQEKIGARNVTGIVIYAMKHELVNL